MARRARRERLTLSGSSAGPAGGRPDPRSIVIVGAGFSGTTDQVVLAFGNLPAGDPPLEIGGLPGPELYLHDAWDTEAVRTIPEDADILLVGTGLTMVDWAFSLGRQGHRGTIHALSRRGLLLAVTGRPDPTS